MSGFSRRGACPSLAVPMQTGDGLLARLVFGSPDFQPTTLITLLEAANRHGNGIVEITSRGSLQIRGLTEISANQLSLAIQNLGLVVGGVPITTGALAGLDRQEISNPLPVANAIRNALGAELRSRLAPKTSIVVDGGGKLSLDMVKADIRLKAVKSDESVAWVLLVGGDVNAARAVGLVDEASAAPVVIDLLSAIADKGPDARGRDLTDAGLAEMALSNTPGSEYENHNCTGAPIGCFEMSDHISAIGIGVPFGAASADKIIELVRAVEEIEKPTIRLAPGRGLILHGVETANAGEITRLAEELGFVTHESDARLAVSSCAGRPYCASGEIETRKLAGKIAAAAGSLLDGSFTLHISGCAKRCAETSGPRLTVLGKSGNCQLLEEFGYADRPPIDMPVTQITDSIQRLDRLFRQNSTKHKPAKKFLHDQWHQLAPSLTDQR